MQQNIKYITMKLDENERANTIRLMKVKDIILKEAIEERRETDKAEAQTCEWRKLSKHLSEVKQNPSVLYNLSVDIFG